jgi:hypothetical protein
MRLLHHVVGLCDALKMKKGQTGAEAVGAVALIMMVYAATLGVGLKLQGEAAGRTIASGNGMACEEFAMVIDSVYAGGPGSHVAFDVRGNFTVGGGVIELGTTENSIYCTILPAAVNETRVVSPGSHNIINGGGFVEFQ